MSVMRSSDGFELVLIWLRAEFSRRLFGMVTADFEAYLTAQRAVGALWQDRSEWWRIAVLNTARMSWFSADRAILDYAREIWRAEPGLG